MNYSKVLITGAGSFIASQILDQIDFGESEIFLVSRKTLSPLLIFKHSTTNHLIIEDFGDEGCFQSVQSFLQLKNDDRLLVLNFIGVFGSIASIDEINNETFHLELKQNLNPFLTLSKLIVNCEAGLFVSFSGGGIGGDNLETISPSYLASKAALVFMIEGLDNTYSTRGVRFTAVSPGAFPSRMQDVVANSFDESVVSQQRRSEAIETLNSKSDPTKLIQLMNFLIKNPEEAGGRIWSANFDQLAANNLTDNFGKLRRIY
jgi:short-subunit dehydrogenase